MNHYLLYCDSKSILEFSGCMEIELRNDIHPHSCYALLNSLVDVNLLCMIESGRCLIVLIMMTQQLSDIERSIRERCVSLNLDYEMKKCEMPVDDNLLSMSIKSYLERRLFTRFEYFKIGLLTLFYIM